MIGRNPKGKGTEKRVKGEKQLKVKTNVGKEPKVKKPRAKKQKKIGEKKRIFTIARKILALCLIPLVVTCIVVTVISARALRSGLETEVQKSLQIVATSVSETYTNLYAGDYRMGLDGTISKGDTKLTGEYTLMDGLKAQTGFEVSLLYGNMRLLTTVQKENGGRATGTSMEKTVFEQVQTGETLFLKDHTISGREYYVYYLPLVNSDGSVIGAIETAMESGAVNETISAQVMQIVVLSLTAIVVAAVLVVLLAKGMVKTMKKIKHFLGKIENGELTVEPDEMQLKKNDELGDIYRTSVKLQSTLRKIVNDIKESSDNLLRSAGKLTLMAQNTQDTAEGVLVSVDEISEGAKVQAEGTATANSNVIRIGEQIDLITEEVTSLTTYANQMAEAEKASVRIVGELNSSNEDTKDSVTKVAEQIIIMNEAVQGIYSAVTMIQNIADETDLLSLNASIEAARAGEAGRGFAVVAEQICRLADQSNRSAKEIEKIIEDVMNTSEKMVEIMEEVKNNMDNQQQKLEETKEKYMAVSEGVENSLVNIDSIKGKMLVLNDSGSAIRTVVLDLSSISEQNAASADATAQAAHDMSDTMGELKSYSEKLVKLANRLEETLVIFKL